MSVYDQFRTGWKPYRIDGTDTPLDFSPAFAAVGEVQLPCSLRRAFFIIRTDCIICNVELSASFKTYILEIRPMGTVPVVS